MALHLQRQTARYPSTETWEDITLTDSYHSFRYQASYSSPTRLSFVVEADSHTLPLDYTDYVRFWDDAAKLPDGVTDQDEDHPIFEGWIEEITPGNDPTGVNVVAYDPTYRASRKAVVMSAAAEVATPDTDFPLDGAASYPRAVWNCPNDQDPDYAFAIGQDWEVGRIIQSILDNGLLPLKHLNAATGAAAYDTDDTGYLSGGGSWTGNMSFKPEEKIVATVETPRGLIERILTQHEPTFKLFFEPGTRLWRMHKLPDADDVTITVNDHTQTYPVISAEVRRSAEGRYSAVKIYGPQGVEWKTAVWNGPGSTTGNTLEPTASSTYTIGQVGEETDCYWSFTINDVDFNRIGMKGPGPISVPNFYAGQVLASGDITTQLLTIETETEYPALVVEYGAGNERCVRIAYLDRRNGIVEIDSGTCLYLWNPAGTPGTDRYVLPTKVTFHYPNLTDPISVRSPTSGFSGTVYSVGGIESELKEYDESLAVDVRYGVPVTTSTRLDRMQLFADRLLEERKDLVHSGAIREHGIDYRFAWLGKRVNIAALKEDGTSLTTGWESIGAWVTDVDIDFEERATTISMHTDQMELFGLDPEALKLRLGIRPATWRMFVNWSTFFYYSGRFGGDWTQTYGVNVETTSGYFDDKGGVQ